ncbi:MAG: hypothetical protein JRN35_05880 [Nitrososphaerota archaeon]|nr:hypothetical protein [Nitrososphaerota archaeon]
MGNKLTVPSDVRCPDCRSKHIWSKSTVIRKGGDRVPRYVCQNCGRTFNDPKRRIKKGSKR